MLVKQLTIRDKEPKKGIVMREIILSVLEYKKLVRRYKETAYSIGMVKNGLELRKTRGSEEIRYLKGVSYTCNDCGETLLLHPQHKNCTVCGSDALIG